eukprot:100973_1
MTSTVVVIDSGTEITKCGFNNSNQPHYAFPTITGTIRHKGIMVGMQLKDYYIGHEAKSKRGILTLKYPMEHGSIVRWDDMERIWHHCLYNELRIHPEDVDHIVLTQNSHMSNSTQNKIKMMQIFFETFNIPSLHIANTSVLALYGNGLCNYNGTVVQLSGGHTSCQAIYQGYPVKHSLQSLPINSRTLLANFRRILTERGYSFCSGIPTEVEEEMRIKMSYVREMNASDIEEIETEYELPDGQRLRIDNERWRALEVYFKPNRIGLDADGIHKLCFNSIMCLDESLRKQMFQNIILCGGNSTFYRFEQRFKNELIQLMNMQYQVRVNAPERAQNPVVDQIKSFAFEDKSEVKRNYLIWKGGAILSSLSLIHEIAITKDEYNECQSLRVKEDVMTQSTSNSKWASYRMLFDKYRFVIVNAYINQSKMTQRIPNQLRLYIARFYIE